MKAKLLLTTLFCLALFIGKAQTVTRLENFDNYASGSAYTGIPIGLEQIDWTFTNVSPTSPLGGITLTTKTSIISATIPAGGFAGQLKFKATNSNTGGSSTVTVTVSIGNTTQDISIPAGPTTEYIVSIANPQVSNFTLQLANTTNAANKAVTIDDLSWTGYISIKEIQFNDSNPGGDGTYPSAQEGQSYRIQGTVTGVKSGVGYYIQEEVLAGVDLGWSGIWVSDASISPARLNIVSASGIVTENNGRTEIVVSVPDSSIILSGNGNEPTANLLIGKIQEKDESVVCEIASSRFVSNDYATGNYTMTIGFETNEANNILISIDNDLFSTSEPIATPRLYDVTGPVNYNGSSFNISPRDNDIDLLEGLDLATLATSTMINPASAIAFNGNIVIECNEIYSLEVYNLAGQKVKAFTGNEGRTEINMEKGVYIVKLNTANYSVTEKVLVK